MTSQLNTIVVADQQADRLAAAERSRRASDASPRPRGERPRRVWSFLRRRLVAA